MEKEKYKISDIVPDEYKQRAIDLAKNHVNWLLEIMRPLLETEFIHGFRHGYEQACLNTKKKNGE